MRPYEFRKDDDLLQHVAYANTGGCKAHVVEICFRFPSNGCLWANSPKTITSATAEATAARAPGSRSSCSATTSTSACTTTRPPASTATTANTNVNATTSTASYNTANINTVRGLDQHPRAAF